VELALAQFPRIIGLREGRLQFDLPAEQVSPELLAKLYAQHEDELQAWAPADHEEDLPATAPAVLMQCR